jgi:surface antigen
MQMKTFDPQLTFAAAFSVAMTMSGCVTSDTGNKQLCGTLLGAGAGGLVGAQFGKGTGKLAATGAGTLVGAMIGAAAGRSLDKADALYASRAEYQALEYRSAGAAVPWRNPDSGHHGSVQPLATWQTPAGFYCREFTYTVFVGSHPENAYGRACRQPDGSWQIAG